MNILLSAYTCGAGCGSEPGVGWNVARGLARRGHHVTVVTSPLYHEQTRCAIDEEQLDIRLILVDNNTKSNLFIKRHVRWQKKAALVLQKEAREHHYDVIHHVTFNQYRGLRDIFQAELPYVVGPVGGAECIPLSLLLNGNLHWSVRLKEAIRYVKADAIPVIRRCNTCRCAGNVLASNPATAERLNSGLISLKEKAAVLPAIAIDEAEILEDRATPDTESPYMLFYGSLSRPEKGIGLVIEAFSAYRQQGGRLKLVVVGLKEEEITRTDSLMQKLQLPEGTVEWRTFVPRPIMLEMMRRSTAVLYMAYRDSGSMSVLEAVALGANVLCFDIGSQSWLPDAFAVKVTVPTVFSGKSACIAALMRGMQQVENLPPRSEQWHRERVEWLKKRMTWDIRIHDLEQAYARVTMSEITP